MQDQLILLRQFVDMRDDMQKMRIQTGNRLAAVTRGDSEPGDMYQLTMQKYHSRYRDLEEELGKQITGIVKNMHDALPVLADMQQVKGVGPLLAARLLVEIDFTRATSASALWKYCGYAPGADRLVKGQRRSYNARARVICYLIGASFLKSRSPYRQIYDDAVAYYAANRDWTPRHRALAAMRKMNKRFLAHLWMVGRQRQGLPIRRPYVQERLGHEHIDRPEDYGWPVLDYVYMDDMFQYILDDADRVAEQELISMFDEAIAAD